MIKAKHDGQYKQVGFIKVRQPDGTYKDVEKKYGKMTGGEYGLVFEKGFTREVEGELPLTLNGIGKPLKDYDINGNTYQSDGVSPDNPQEVVGCGDRMANLFDGEYEVGYISPTTGELQENSQRYRATNFMPVMPNTRYTFSKSSGTGYFWVIAYKDDFTGVGDGHSSYPASVLSAGDDNGKTVVTFTTTPTTRYVKWYTTSKSGVPTQLNEGETALPYEPYGYKIPVVTRGKNLFNKGNTTVYQAFINANNYWFSTTDGSKSIRIPVEPDTTYTLSMGVSPAIFRIFESDLEDPTPTGIKVSRIIYSGNISEYTFTTSSTAKFLIFQGSGAVFDEWFNTLQLELGSTATEYEPYHEPIETPIFLDKPLYKIGDYADILSYSGKSVERAIKELILTGEEEGWLFNTVITATYAFQNYELISDYKREPFICTHMPVNANSSATSTHGFYGQRLTLCFAKSSGLSDVDKFKSYLKEQYNNGTPVKVYYILAEPETKTVESVEIPTLNGTTVIDVDTEVKPSNMWVEYKSSK